MAQLEQFKEKIGGLKKDWQDDEYLNSWLEACDNDLGKAEEQYRKSMEFREKMGADTLVESYDPPEVLKQYYAGGYVGYDKSGSAVKVELFGCLDMKGLMRSSTVTDLYRNKMKETEAAVRAMRARGNKIGITAIVDMEGSGTEWLWPPGVSMYVKLANIVEESYPGIVKKLLLVNAPAVFPMIWKLVRPLLNERLRSKIEVLGGNQSEVLLKHIDADQLPAYLGGNLRDEDGNERCVSKICQGGKVPAEYYLSTATSDGEGMQQTTVAAKGSFKLSFSTESAGAVISYEFRTVDHDIGFCVRHVTDDDVTTDIVLPQRVASHTVTEDGTITCQKLGTYDIIFDNTYSVMTPKTLYYRVLLHQTDDVTEKEVSAMSQNVA